MRHARSSPRQMASPWWSLACTCLLMILCAVLLAAVRQRSAWDCHGQINGFLVAAESAARASLPPLPPLPAAPLPELISHIDALPAQAAEAELVELPELPPVASALLPVEWDEAAHGAPAARKPLATRQAAAPAARPPALAAEAKGEFTPPAYLRAPLPPYPASMRQSRVEGVVRLRIFLDEHGKPLRVEVADSSGHAEFDATARSWVLQRWEFTPAQLGGRPVPGSVVARVRFVLH